MDNNNNNLKKDDSDWEYILITFPIGAEMQNHTILSTKRSHSIILTAISNE